jgi:uncharacterized protein (DUF362 family)
MGVPFLCLIFAAGVHSTIRLDFIQFRHPVFLFQETIVKAFRKNGTAKVLYLAEKDGDFVIKVSKEDIIAALGFAIAFSPVPQRVGIKINLPSLPTPQAPKTDPDLLVSIIDFLAKCGCSVTILEGAKGHLSDHLVSMGLKTFLKERSVSALDIDHEQDVTFYEKNGRRYAIPNALQRLNLRIALPCATKRPGYLFSCNVKTFVGLLPRDFCQNGTLSIFSRPIVHEDLTITVSDIFLLVNQHAPFQFYINGGNCISETSDILKLPACYLSKDAVALDFQMASHLKTPPPPYLLRLRSELSGEKKL